MSNEIIRTHISAIQSLIDKGATLTDAVSGYFAETVNDTDIQKIILRELSEIYKDQTKELKKLYPWNPEFFTKDVKGFENYLKNYKPENGYRCNVFATSNFDEGKLVFDRGRMNFVGARTSRGKTTAMVSMAVDALKQGMPVLFSTFEETDIQIITRIVLNLTYRLIIDDYKDNDANFRSRINLTPFSPGKIFQSIIRCGHAGYNPFKSNVEIQGKKQDEEDLKELSRLLLQGYEEAKTFLQEGKLMIFNGYLSDLQTYLDALANIERGTVVFADYIQKIPIPMIGNSASRYAGIKQLLRDLDAAVKKNDLISINGAQFGRTDNKTNSKVKDSFTDESFQESSDIEQIGEIEIGIGRDPAKKDKEKARMFFSVLKNRNGENNPALEFDLVDGRKFSYYATRNTEGHY